MNSPDIKFFCKQCCQDQPVEIEAAKPFMVYGKSVGYITCKVCKLVLVSYTVPQEGKIAFVFKKQML